MVNDESLNVLFDYLLDNKIIKASKLNEIGYSSKKIKKLVGDGILSHTEKRGYYQLSNMDELYGYGMQLIDNHQYERATVCFEKCYKINPNHGTTCVQLFYRAVKNNKYEDAFKYLDGFYDEENQFYHTDNKLYLYLLSYLTFLPEKYQNEIVDLKYDDIKISECDDRFENIGFQNKVRFSIYHKRFDLAISQLNGLAASNGKIEFQNLIIRSLLKNIIYVKRKIISGNNDINTRLNNKNTDIDERAFVQRKAQMVIESKGVFVFALKNDERRVAIEEVLKEMPNLAAFCVGEEPYQKVVLRYRAIEQENEYKDFKQIKNIYESYYAMGDYDRCLEEIKYFLSILDNPQPYLFYKMALCYYQKQQIDIALTYLIVTAEMNRDLKIYDHDLSSFIKYLKSLLREERASEKSESNEKADIAMQKRHKKPYGNY